MPMPKAACRFRHSELTRAIKAAKAAGVRNFRVDIDSAGTISVIVAESLIHSPKDLTDAVRREREEDRRARRW